MFASGGVHALVHLLENVLEHAENAGRGVWLRELLALLYPLVRRSRMVAHMLAARGRDLARILATCTDPLTLSLGE